MKRKFLKKSYPLEDDFRLIGAIYADEYFELVDQKSFEDSMKSLDEMVEDKETTMIT